MIQLSINNFEELLNPIADDLPEQMNSVYTGLLVFVEKFGYQYNQVAQESLDILTEYVNKAYEPEPIQEVPGVKTASEVWDASPDVDVFQKPEQDVTEQVQAFEATAHDTNVASKTETQQTEQDVTEPVKKLSTIVIKGEGFRKAAEALRDLFAKSTEDTDVLVEASEPLPEEITVLKTDLPVFPEQQYIINLIRIATNNQPVTRELVTDLAGSITRFCKEIANQSAAMHQQGEVIAKYGHQTIYLRLVEVINYDAVKFVVKKS